MCTQAPLYIYTHRQTHTSVELHVKGTGRQTQEMRKNKSTKASISQPSSPLKSDKCVPQDSRDDEEPLFYSGTKQIWPFAVRNNHFLVTWMSHTTKIICTLTNLHYGCA